MELISTAPAWWLLLLVPMFVAFRYSLVDAPFRKRVLAFGFRVLGLLLLVVALCRPFAFSESDAMHVVFLVDVSQSVDPESAKAAAKTVDLAIDRLVAADGWSLFAVGDGGRKFDRAAALVEWVDGWKTAGADDAFRSASRLGEAVLQTRMEFPAGKAKRIVLMSDGQETGGSLEDALRQVSAERIDVRMERLKPLTFPEAAIVSLRPSSSRAFTGEVVRMAVEVVSNQPVGGRLRIIHRGVAVQEQAVELRSDRPNRFWFDVDMVTPGASQWTAELVPDEDHFPVNNQRSSTLTFGASPVCWSCMNESRKCARLCGHWSSRIL